MSDPELTSIERAALALGRFTNERPAVKSAQHFFVRRITQPWVRVTVARRSYIDGGDWLGEYAPDRGVVLAANHRSFFDQYVGMLAMYECGADWARRLYFPVRSNFFYESAVGVLVNYSIGGGAMYPPIFRDPAKSLLNADALDRVKGFLAEPGTVVGVHPEGTRGKGPDPYEILPAQPGIGQIVLRSLPVVIPMFINGLSNDFVGDVRANFRRDIRRERPIIMCFGQPLDYSDLTTVKPRAALYKRCSDRIREAIIELSRREQVIRARCLAGEIGDDDPNWMTNKTAARRKNGLSNGA